MSTRMDNYPGLHEDDTNSTYCEQCGCRITRGMCKHGIRPPVGTPAFTPGPWAASLGNSIEDHRYYVAARRDTVSGWSFYDIHVAWVSTEADARLIAAAPKMLAALYKIDSNAAESAEWIRRVTREAIAEAEGE